MATNIAQLHQIFIHFPIILFTAALICDLLYGLGKKTPLYMGHWFVILGVVMCIPTLITGQEAAKAFNSEDFYLQKHRFLGFMTGVAGSLYSGLRISAMRWDLKINPVFYVAVSVLMVALISWTSDYGALITHSGKSQKKTFNEKIISIKEN